VAVAKSFAAFSQSGRVWPRAESYDASLHIGGYAVEGFADADASQLRISDLFRHLPAAVLKARVVSAAKPARKRVHLSGV
jgi:(1->4)-alpha-D-glucan 1-alpha-D-glucosylmutase